MSVVLPLRPPAAATPDAVRIDHVERRYGRLTAIDDLSLGIPKGETFGMLGPNGAGKSTLMRLLAGADEPDAGSVTLEGAPVTRHRTRARIGIAPQDIALYGNMTAAENLYFAGRLYGLAGRYLAERVSFALDVAALGARRHDRVKGFSGGMQRRLNLACAIVHDPALVLLDEPTAGVDPQSRNHIFAALERLRESRVTIVYSTHYMEEAERLCDRVGIVDHGRLLALGRLDELTRRHGGGHTVSVEVEGPLPDGLPLPRAQVEGKVVFVTHEPWQLVNELTRSRARILTLHIERPSLEGVFLALTGRSLRD